MWKVRNIKIKLWFIWEYIIFPWDIEKGTERNNNKKNKKNKKRRWENVKCQVKTVGAHAVVMSH